MGSGDFDYKEIVDATMGSEISISVPKEQFSFIIGGGVRSPFVLIEEPIVKASSDLPLPTIQLPEPAKKVTEQILSKSLVNNILNKSGEISLSVAGELLAAGIIPLTTDIPQVISETMIITETPTKVNQYIQAAKIKESEYFHPILKYMKG